MLCTECNKMVSQTMLMSEKSPRGVVLVCTKCMRGGGW